MEQPKEVLIEMLARVAGINMITIASLAVSAPDVLETIGLWNPQRQGTKTMREVASRHKRTQ